MSTSRCCNVSPSPITISAIRYPGIKLHDPRIIHFLFEVLLRGSHISS